MKLLYLFANRCVMVSCISPTSDSTNHTLNTLRYADRVKEKKSVGPDDFEDTGSPGRLTMKELEVVIYAIFNFQFLTYNI